MKSDFSRINQVLPMDINCFIVKGDNFIYEKSEAIKMNNGAKNVPKICIKLCAADIFGCRICICSI